VENTAKQKQEPKQEQGQEPGQGQEQERKNNLSNMFCYATSGKHCLVLPFRELVI